MTKKHYVAIAAMFAFRLSELRARHDLNAETHNIVRIEILSCAGMFCGIAERDNAQFDRARFLTACSGCDFTLRNAQQITPSSGKAGMKPFFPLVP